MSSDKARSRQHTLKSLSALEKVNTRGFLQSQGNVCIDLQFCAENYMFTDPNTEELFFPPQPQLH